VRGLGDWEQRLSTAMVKSEGPLVRGDRPESQPDRDD
jgi:hypothetical protein